jgi:hypothetical protein
MLISKVPGTITKSLQLRRVDTIPLGQDAPLPPQKPHSTQPKGLIMRWRPSGFIHGDPGVIGEPDEVEEAAPVFETPPEVPGISSLSQKKRKREERGSGSHKKSKSISEVPKPEIEDTAPDVKEKKKSKKQRHIDEVMNDDGQEKKRKKDKHKDKEKKKDKSKSK